MCVVDRWTSEFMDGFALCVAVQMFSVYVCVCV